MLKKLFSTTTLISLLLFSGCFNQAKESPYVTAKVERGHITQKVSVTGTVETDAKIDLRFQKAGEVDSLSVKEGDYVRRGQTLATIEGRDLIIKRNEALAGLDYARAKLDQMLAGNTEEEIAVARTNVASAKITLTNAQTTLESVRNVINKEIEKAELTVTSAEETLNSTETTLANAEDTLKDTREIYQQDIDEAYDDTRVYLKSLPVIFSSALEAADQILGVDNEEANDGFENNLTARSNIEFNEAQRNYGYAKLSFTNLESELSALTDESETEITQSVESAETVIEKFRLLLDNTYSILEDAVIGGSLSQTELSTKKTSINTEQTGIETAASTLETYRQTIASASLTLTTKTNDAKQNVLSAKSAVAEAEIALQQAQQTVAKVTADGNKTINDASNAVRNAQAGLTNAEANLALKEAAPREVDLAALRAEVTKAQTVLDLTDYEVGKLTMTAPAGGVITAINFDPGENVSSADIFLTLITSEFQVVSNVSETDITKLTLDNKVEMTLDAFGPDKKFIGRVVEIDPAETIVQGVIYYQIKVLFAGETAGVKPGMTANLDIITAEITDVLTAPIRAVKYRDSEKYVEILENNQPKDVVIETGIEGDIVIEVKSGLNEGDEVITFVQEE